MTAASFNVAWSDRIAVVNSTGCWIAVAPRPPWMVSRKLIAELFDVADTACGITPACIHPLHNEDTRRPAGAAS